MNWYPAARARALATAALLALVAAVLTGHAALVLLAAPALGALALLPRRSPPELDIEVTLSSSRCFEGEDVTVTATVRATSPLDELIVELEPAAQVALDPGTGASPRAQAFLRTGEASTRWVIRPLRWGRPSPGTVRVAGRAGAVQTTRRIELDPVEVFPRPALMRPRLVPAELLRRIGEHTGRAVGDGVEFAGIRPYVPGDQLRDVNRAVSIRRGQLHVNQRSAARAADLVVMIDAFGDSGPVSERTLDLAVHGAAALVTAYLRVSDRAGLVVLGGLLRWLGPAAGDRQFYRIAEMMLAARFDSYVTPDVGRIPRTALPPGTLVVVFSPLLDPRGFGAISDLRQRGFPLILVDTLRDEPPPGTRPDARLALRLWRLDRSATRARLRALGIPVLRWDTGAELDSVLAPLRQPPPGVRRLAGTRP
ncbi:MAG TPA: DUF58 domain-containing protein [Streptosporangiaceae bacterium]|nr:DUF58 domain-containing protein [Streptosporangiaceae bacterium]